MDILLVHPSLNEMGGSEKLALIIIESLKEKGYDVTLGTFEKTIWKKVTEFNGDVCIPDMEFIYPRLFGKSAYGELLNFHFLFSKIPKKFKIVIISTCSPWYYCPVVGKLIVYFNCAPINHMHGLKHVYLLPYNFIQKKLLKKVESYVFLTNSSFSSEVIRRIYGLRTEIVHPPVDLKMFHPSSHKENLVISVGRFNPTKNYEFLIRAFSKVKDGKCLIVGSARDRVSFKYLKKLRRLINHLGLDGKVSLIVNIPLHILRDILSRAKIYVHCTQHEYFGISIVEAMASGCVPIVYRSGGPYTDIIEYGKYGLSFVNINELADKVSFLLKSDEVYKRLGEKALRRSKSFDKENFKKRIMEIIEC
jgi:glycosyltransferase involved in cell wall biosynthesis